MSTRRKSYENYLNGGHWKTLRRSKLSLNPVCEVCGTRTNLVVHHIRYRKLIDVRLEDLVTLCESDHDDFHDACRLLKYRRNCCGVKQIKEALEKYRSLSGKQKRDIKNHYREQRRLNRRNRMVKVLMNFDADN